MQLDVVALDIEIAPVTYGLSPDTFESQWNTNDDYPGESSINEDFVIKSGVTKIYRGTRLRF